MKLNYSETSIIIIGGWNPSILNPIWINKYLIEPNSFGNEKLPNMAVNVDDTLSIKDASMSVSFDGIRIVLAGSRLEFHLEISKDFNLLEKYALKTFRLVPNTFVTGYGVNFHFYDEKIGETIASIINTNMFDNLKDLLISKQQCNLMFQLDNMNMNISTNMDNQNNTSGFRFNFHFNIDGLPIFESRLSEYSVSGLKERAVNILSSVYGLEVEV